MTASEVEAPEEADAHDDAMPVRPAASRVITRSTRRRRPARISGASRSNVRARVKRSQLTGATKSGSDQNLDSELRNWVKENASLLSNASLLISISALALKALPGNGLINPYIQALMVAAALILLVEMHFQWPEDLQIHAFRGRSFPENHSWRMTSFALLMQFSTVVFAVWAALTNPAILLPLTAFGVYVAFRRWYFQRFQNLPARIVGIIVFVLVLLITELLMLILSAILSGEEVTLQILTSIRLVNVR